MSSNSDFDVILLLLAKDKQLRSDFQKLLAETEVLSLFLKDKDPVELLRGMALRRRLVHGERKPLVICGPSGVGKGTTIAGLLKQFPQVFAQSKSFTTRKPREDDKFTNKYLFVSKEEFLEKKQKHGEFLEDTTYNGQFYGTSIGSLEEIVKAERVPLIEVEINSTLKLRMGGFEANYLFIMPPRPFEQTLRERMAKRGDPAERIEQRIKIALTELAMLEGLTYFDVLENASLDTFNQQLLEKLREWYPALL